MKLLAFLVIIVLLFTSPFKCSSGAQNSSLPVDYKVSDSVKAEANTSTFFKKKSNLSALNFPSQTLRIYEKMGFNYLWFRWNKQNELWDAMMILDCVIQYGLISSSYHPNVLTYSDLRICIEDTVGTRADLKAKFDVFLTDAMITFINHLHYGRINPYAPQNLIDEKENSNFNAYAVLLNALEFEFSKTILSVQPSDQGYTSLQQYLKLVAGQYAGDCYEISEDSLKLIALNMERYKWYNVNNSDRLEVNIPSYSLKFYEGNQVETFRVIVGKPGNRTPTLVSAVGSLKTAPDWSVPARIFRRELLPKILKDPSFADRNNFAIYNKNGKYIQLSSANLKYIKAAPAQYFARQSAGCDNALGKIVFDFANPYSIYLHDTPNRSLFSESNRALSHGCIRVENPEKLAERILNAVDAPEGIYAKVSGAMNEYHKYQYTFHKKIPIVIRYITCEIKDGVLVVYKDVYNKDSQLIGQLFLPKTDLN